MKKLVVSIVLLSVASVYADVAERFDELRGGFGRRARQSTGSVKSSDAACTGKEAPEIVCPSVGAVRFKGTCYSKKKCEKVYYITQDDLKGRGENGIILKKPGTYKLCSDIEFKPTIEGAVAINIASSDVVLDFGPYTLSQGNKTCFVDGVRVCRDVRCVKITGVEGQAKVLDMTQAGIHVLGRTDLITLENLICTQTKRARSLSPDVPTDNNVPFIYGFVVGEGDKFSSAFKGTDAKNHVTNVKARNVVASKNHWGFTVAKVVGFELVDSSMVDNVNVGWGAAFLLFDEEGVPDEPYTADGILQNVHMDRNGSTEPTFGVSPCLSNRLYNYQFISCTFDSNFYFDPNNYMLVFCDDACRSILMKGCTFNDNYGSLGSGLDACHYSGSIGNLELNRAIVIEDCEALRNRNEWPDNGTTPSGFTKFGSTNGFSFPFGMRGLTVKNCHAHRNVSFSGECHGFLFEGTADLPNPEGEGLSTDFITVEGCTAHNNVVTQENGKDAFGFKVSVSANNLNFFNCSAHGNTSAGTEGYSAGVGIVSNIFFTGPDIERVNSILFTGGSFAGNGSGKEGDAGVLIRRNNLDQAEINRVVIQDTTTLGNKGDGIRVDGDVTNVILKRNECDANDQVGIRIINNPNPVAVHQNILYNNAEGEYEGPPVVMTI